MPLLGQASGGFNESSSALRILFVGVRNTVGVLSNDSFTQANPPHVVAAATVSTSPGLLANTLGVLSGSIAFTRPDAVLNGNAPVGGPEYGVNAGTAGTLTDAQASGVQEVGVFINNAAGNPFENTPAAASGKGPYVSSQGTYGNGLFETQALAATAGLAQGAALSYQVGAPLIASVNGYLMPRFDAATGDDCSLVGFGYAAEQANGGANAVYSLSNTAATPNVIGVLKMTPDAVMNEIVYDQRI